MHHLITTTLTFIIIVFIVYADFATSLPSNDTLSSCEQSFYCGNIKDVYFPFSGGPRPASCGLPGFQLACTDDSITLLTVNSLSYRVIQLDQITRTMILSRSDLYNSTCTQQSANTTFNHTHFSLGSDNQILSLFYGCNDSVMPIKPDNLFTCEMNGKKDAYYLIGPVPSDPVLSIFDCSVTMTVPILDSLVHVIQGNRSLLGEVLRKGFNVSYSNPYAGDCDKCYLKGGFCGFDSSSENFLCICGDRICPGGKSSKVGLGVGLGVAGAAAVGIGLGCWFLLIRQRRKRIATQTQSGDLPTAPASKVDNMKNKIWAIFCAIPVLAIAAASAITFSLGCYCCFKRQGICSGKTMTLQWKNAKQEEKMETFFMNYHSQMPKQYSYSDIEKMTNSFTQKLGEGGFGGVYKGKLPDSHSVAVKVLNKSTGDGEEFINEVASISRTSHVNIVSLLGFCYERTKRALIYEYMPNGSLDKFICDQSSELGWKILYDIAIGIASGLEYLHRGCNTRIVHFDIKPQNVLLDEDFCPKISDFGLAKLCNKKESILSMLGARGTPGYIAPEVFMTSFGRVSYKSDVYSYGMMILEMFGGKNNIDFGASQDSEMYFPDCLYKRLELGQNYVLDENIQVEEEQTVIRRMIIVGLWCIQTSPSDRPSMTRVLEMLEGRLQPLQIPPKPLLFSTATPMEHSRATHLWSQSNQEVVSSLAEVELAPNSKQ